MSEEGPQTPALQKRLLTFMLSKNVPVIPDESERIEFAEKQSNFIQKLLFTWLFPIIRVGYKRTLVPEDMYKLTDDLKVESMAQSFYENFEQQHAKAQAKWVAKKCKKRKETLSTSTVDISEDLKDFKLSKWRVVTALYLTFQSPYTWACINLTLSQLAQALNPLLIKKLIQYVQDKTLGIEEGNGKGIGYAIGVTAIIFFNGVTLNQSLYRALTVGAKVKAVLTKAVLDKSFKINAEGKHRFPPGKITSIMGADLSRIDFATGLQIYVVVVPVPIIAAIVVLVLNIGPIALVGVALVIAFLFLMSFCTTKLFKYRKTATVFTDARINYIKECLNNLRIIKYYSWEPPYYKSISDVRKKEMKIVYTMQVLRNVVTALAMNLNVFCSMITFLSLFAAKGEYDTASIFSSLSVFNVLTQVLVLMPMALASGSDASVGLGRVGEFLTCDEVQSTETSIEPLTKFKDSMAAKNIAVKIDHASFEWEVFDGVKEDQKETKIVEDKEKAVDKEQSVDLGYGSTSEQETLESHSFPGLRDIDFEIKKGEFVVITGLIGSGKSSLLSAISGTMKRTEGSVNVDGSLILCGQPWIQNATVKDNITFGSELDEQRYADVIYACSLESDLSLFPAGDRTEIGERGVTLSGGQKARLSLARSVYVDKDIILLDDVLSAVDARVGKHIMEKCIQGMLQDKTRILATHQLSLIGSADRIIFLNGDGTVSIGSAEQLQETNNGFRKLMAFNQATDSDEGEEAEEIEEVQDEEIEEVQEEQIQEDEAIEENESVKSVQEESKRKEYNTDTQVDGRLILSENKSDNGISAVVYKRYFENGCGALHPVVMIILSVIIVMLATGCLFLTSTWLSFWTAHKFDISNGVYIGVYVTLAVCAFLLFLLEFVLIAFICNKSSTKLNIMAIERVLYSKMSFLDTTPMGRILNRFTKDTDVLDNELGEQTRYLVFTGSNLIGVFVLCIIFLPWFAIAIPCLAAAITVIANLYMSSSREVKRLESVQRSFVYNNFNECLSGMSTIKAYNAQDRFLDKNSNFINKMNESYYITIAIQRWLTIYLALIASVFTLIISILCVNGVFSISASSTGLLLSYTLSLTGQLSLFIRNFTQVINGMNSVERICDFAYDLEEEAPYLITETTPAPKWPQKGEITFANVSMSYRPGLPLVLRDVNFKVGSQEKIGICGRTGAGKSSIMTALYRIAELGEGKIEIDGVDISNLGLKDFRSKLSIIPQDPILFKGTIRHNLDPFEESSDDKLWDSLRRSGLVETDRMNSIKQQTVDDENLHKFHIDQMVEDDGSNFSLGERQLIAFARALVRNSKMLILDEATSSVDYETDSKIQETIVREFSHCTILCIAHRLKTIVNYDRILVLDQGQVKEFDTPWKLFNKDGGIFQQMCQKSSIIAEDFDM